MGGTHTLKAIHSTTEKPKLVRAATYYRGLNNWNRVCGGYYARSMTETPRIGLVIVWARILRQISASTCGSIIGWDAADCLRLLFFRGLECRISLNSGLCQARGVGFRDYRISSLRVWGVESRVVFSLGYRVLEFGFKKTGVQLRV